VSKISEYKKQLLPPPSIKGTEKSISG